MNEEHILKAKLAKYETYAKLLAGKIVGKEASLTTRNLVRLNRTLNSVLAMLCELRLEINSLKN